MASNPDIARAATEPDIDFYQGTALTNSVVEAMRTSSAKRILYASGSGVYGDCGQQELAEDQGSLLPIFTSGEDRAAEIALAHGARVLKTPKRGLGRAYQDALPYIRGKFTWTASLLTMKRHSAS